jgi:hypothetical protein
MHDNKNSFDATAEQSIMEIVLNGWRNGELAVGSTKGRIEMFINKLFSRYTEDLQKFCRDILKDREIKIAEDKLLT